MDNVEHTMLSEAWRRPSLFVYIIPSGVMECCYDPRSFPQGSGMQQAFIDNNRVRHLSELKELSSRVLQRRRFWEDLGHVASQQGVPVASVYTSQGAQTKTPDTAPLVSTGHDQAVHEEGVRREVEQDIRSANHEARVQEGADKWAAAHTTQQLHPTDPEHFTKAPGEAARTVSAEAEEAKRDAMGRGLVTGMLADGISKMLYPSSFKKSQTISSPVCCRSFVKAN